MLQKPGMRSTGGLSLAAAALFALNCGSGSGSTGTGGSGGTGGTGTGGYGGTGTGLDAASCAPLSSCTGTCWPATWTEALANLCNHPEVIAVPNCLGYDEIWEAMSNGSSYTIYYDANTGNLIGEEFNHGDPGGGITCYGTLGSSQCTPSTASTFSCGGHGG